MTKEDREKRNYLIYARFLAGHSEAEIGRAVGVTGQRIHQILQTELKNSARHRQLLTDEALAVYVSRLETLLKAVWPDVLKGDAKAVDTARRVLEQQSRLYGLEDGQAAALPPIPSELTDEDAPIDELTKYRLQHRQPPAAEAQ